MTQGKLTTSGDIEFQPTSWDGEPLYSTATVQEGLFSADAFDQMRGQTAWTLAICPCCRQDFYADASDVYCPRCMEIGS